MNERIKLTFLSAEDDHRIDVTDFKDNHQDGGLVLGKETSALPRALAIGIRPEEGVTKMRVESVRRRLDWQADEMRLKLTREDKCLSLAGCDAEALPPGRYEIEIRVSGMRRLHRRVTIPNSEELILEMKERMPKYRFEFMDGSFDPGTQKILQCSKLDGQDAVDWLKQDSPVCRDRRKACLLNILAKLATVPSTKNPLNQYVQRIEVVEPDRVYAKVAPKFFKTVRNKFLKKDRTVHASHKRLLRRFDLKSQGYKLESYREDRAKASLQIVGAVPPNEDNEIQFVDIDIDRANPSYDVMRATLHFGHLFGPGKTNHLKLRRNELNQGAVKDFLYYRATRRRKKRVSTP